MNLTLHTKTHFNTYKSKCEYHNIDSKTSLTEIKLKFLKTYNVTNDVPDQLTK